MQRFDLVIDTSDLGSASQPPGWKSAYETSLANALDSREDKPFLKLSHSCGKLSGTLGMEIAIDVFLGRPRYGS